MGSLMAGWDSHASDPKQEKMRRNSSLTKEEIEAFWRSRKEKEQEHLTHISTLSPRSQKRVCEEVEVDEPNLDKLIQKNGWWMSSNSAFLNEPPVIGNEGRQSKYAAQFHVAEMNTSKTDMAQKGVSTYEASL